MVWPCSDEKVGSYREVLRQWAFNRLACRFASPSASISFIFHCSFSRTPHCSTFLGGAHTHANMASSASISSKSTDEQPSGSKAYPEDIEATSKQAHSTTSPQPDEKDAGPEAGFPALPFSPRHEILFIFMVCMAQFLSLAGLAQSIAPLELIGRSFGVTDEATLSWYPASFSLTYGTFILPAGRLISLKISRDVLQLQLLMV